MAVLSKTNKLSRTSFHPVFLLILVCFMNFATTKAKNDDTIQSMSCSNKNKTTPNSVFQLNLKSLLSYLSSNATANKHFYNTTVADKNNSSNTVYGMFMCMGDVPAQLCSQCVTNMTRYNFSDSLINSDCSLSKEVVMRNDNCMVRYSNISFFSTADLSPSSSSCASVNMSNQAIFQRLVSETLNEVADEAANFSIGVKKYATKEATISEFQTLYFQAQCTPDLSPQDCRKCLNVTIMEVLLDCKLNNSVVANSKTDSCYIRYDVYPFYRPNNSPTPSASDGRPPRMIPVVAPIILSTLLLAFSCYLLRKRARKSNYKTLNPKNNFGKESTTLRGLQFKMAVIKTATNNFSHENKIGEGGFGQVYKGILSDGRHIAAKRLSSNSNQGIVEFKNEILLIAKLQQRNLVALIGFCLEDQEKILIYEYVPNGSLDYFLFDTQQQTLSWDARYKIIEGTALGILYLHEYSCLKVIHCDLKPSNVLLDENMNPKISDFGMARMVQINENRGHTTKIAGTWGYMSPEYAMLGQYSEKSDVFSFGVIVLEIISGKRNINPYDPHHTAGGLTSYVWRQWKNETPLIILDSKIENYSPIEVIKCIQIGLLCVQENPNVRPTMSTVVSYLKSHSPKLPSPQEPAFFIHS